MIKNIINRKPVAVFVVVSILLCMGISAFANEEDNNNESKTILHKGQKNNFTEKKFEEILKNLVKEKKITEERSIVIKQEFNKEISQRKEHSFFKGSHKKYKHHKIYSIISGLHEKEIITTGEADAIKTKIREMKKQNFNQALEELVNKNIITKTKSKEIQEYINKDRSEKISKFKNMTKEEKRLYFKENRKLKKDIINKMIDDNVITEEQGNEIRKVLKKNRN